MSSLTAKYGSSAITEAQAAQELGVSVEDIQSMLEACELKSVSLCGGKIVRIPVDQIDRLLGNDGGAIIPEQRKEHNRAENEPIRVDFQTQESYSHHHTYLDAMFEDFTEKDDDDMAVAVSMGKARNHGDGSVFWSESRQEWRAQFNIVKDGMKKRKLLTGFKTESEARRQMILVQSLERGEIKLPEYEEARAKPVVHDVLFADVVHKHVKLLMSDKKKSSRALKDKVRLFGELEQKFGNSKLSDINSEDLQLFLNNYAGTPYIRAGKEKNYSQSAIDKMYNNLNCCLEYARKAKLIASNPMNDVDKPTTLCFDEDASVTKDLTDEEIRMLLAAVEPSPMFRTMILIMLYTGIRPAEAFALKYTDFNFEAKSVKMRRALSIKVDIERMLDTEYRKKVEEIKKENRNRKREDKIEIKPLSECIIGPLKNERTGEINLVARRTLHAHDEVLEAVESLWDMIHADDNKVVQGLREAKGWQEYLFTAPTDGEIKRPDYYIQEYVKILRKNGIDSSKYNMYRFRHTLCTWLFRRLKLSPKEAARIMGDSSMDMVMRVYQSVSEEDTNKNSEMFSDEMCKVIAGSISNEE